MLTVTNDRYTASATPRPHVIALHGVVSCIRECCIHPVALGRVTSTKSIKHAAYTSVFHRSLGRSPVRFIGSIHIHTTTGLLMADSLPVTAITGRANFSSTDFFSHAFRQFVNIAPVACQAARAGQGSRRWGRSTTYPAPSHVEAHDQLHRVGPRASAFASSSIHKQ